MNILLDTHIFLWAAEENSRLSPKVRAILKTHDRTIFFSAISSLEISIKWSKGILKLPEPPTSFVTSILVASGISQLPVTVIDACAVAELPLHHKDPFDRVLVAQARTNGLQLMTADPMLAKYDVDIIALWDNKDDE